MSVIEYVLEEGIATITLNNPPQNRLTRDLLLGFAEIVQTLAVAEGLRGVLVKSAISDFSHGGDITTWSERSLEQTKLDTELSTKISNAFEDLPVPIVIAVKGLCAGGGFELALRGDIILAGESASFRHPEKTLGVFTLLGGIQRVADRVGRTRAMQWAFTGEEISATAAEQYGLINAVVADDELDALAETWVQQLRNGPTLAHRAHKQLLRAWSNGGVEAADALMPELSVNVFGSEDAQMAVAKSIDAFHAGEPRPDFDFTGR